MFNWLTANGECRSRWLAATAEPSLSSKRGRDQGLSGQRVSAQTCISQDYREITLLFRN